MAKIEKVPAKYYVATYGDMGLEVEFFTDPLAYGRALRTAEKDHSEGRLDSYTGGNCNVFLPPAKPNSEEA